MGLPPRAGAWLPGLGMADTGDAAGWPNYRMILLPRVTDTDRMSPTKKAFRYEEAFARNLGWVTEAEQAALRGKRIAIAGAGGVGAPCSSSAGTRPANGAGRSAASQTMAGDSFRKVKLCDQPASLATVAFQIALPSGAARAMPWS